MKQNMRTSTEALQDITKNTLSVSLKNISQILFLLILNYETINQLTDIQSKSRSIMSKTCTAKTVSNI